MPSLVAQTIAFFHDLGRERMFNVFEPLNAIEGIEDVEFAGLSAGRVLVMRCSTDALGHLAAVLHHHSQSRGFGVMRFPGLRAERTFRAVEQLRHSYVPFSQFDEM
jgi:hypothetical protein